MQSQQTCTGPDVGALRHIPICMYIHVLYVCVYLDSRIRCRRNHGRLDFPAHVQQCYLFHTHCVRILNVPGLREHKRKCSAVGQGFNQTLGTRAGPPRLFVCRSIAGSANHEGSLIPGVRQLQQQSRYSNRFFIHSSHSLMWVAAAREVFARKPHHRL